MSAPCGCPDGPQGPEAHPETCDRCGRRVALAQDLDRTRMREVLAKCTPGRWKIDGMRVMADQDGTSDAATAVPVASVASPVSDRLRTWNAEHIRLTQPQDLSRLLDAIDLVEGLIDTMTAIAEHPDSPSRTVTTASVRDSLRGCLAPLRAGWRS